jgi:predicted acylesterase/phospholipase RssA
MCVFSVFINSCMMQTMDQTDRQASLAAGETRSQPAARYQRCLVMAGGAFRFTYYLGMYAALSATGKRPDLLLASCGGSIAAAIIQALPDDESRLAWVSSPAMYDFLCGLQSTPRAAIGRSLLHAVRRRFDTRRAGLVPDLFHDYFFEIPPQLPLPPPRPDPEVAVAIVGGRILYEPEDVGQPRAGRKLFAETVFCDQRTASLLEGMSSALGDPRWGDNAIARQLVSDTAMPIGDAVRISISDMFYFRCHSHASGHYMGGVVDLFPIEVANRLAYNVMMEMKSQFDLATSIPALRAVLGIDGNQRLRHIHDQHADVWIDTSDVEQSLRAQGVQKQLSWRQNRIRLVMPGDYAHYVADVSTQWQYGYDRAMEALGMAASSDRQGHMRNANRHNRNSYRKPGK